MGIQDFGEKFDLGKLLRARDLAREMAHELAGLMRPGMVEEDAHQLYQELSQKYGVEKQWHPPKLRLGPNTVKPFRAPSDPHVLLGNDVFFIDIGPVFDGHEADYGETFPLGSDYEHKKICEAARTIWEEVANHWRTDRVKGIPLYEFAKSRAQLRDYQLNLESADGHRIGDFPHHVHFKGALVECEEEIVPNAWILEIQLIEPKKRFGAFYEDILTEAPL